MKKMLVVCTVLLLFAGLVFATDPAEGFWISYDDKTGKATAGWKIWEENNLLFGKILSLAGYAQDVIAGGAKGKETYDDFPAKGDMAEMKIVGTTWIYNLKKSSEGNWTKGSIVDPNNGNKYKCKVTFHKADGKKYIEDTLETRGEIGIGIGRSQYWKRTTEDGASGLR